MERLVAGDTHKSVHAVRLQKILVPTDFSQPSQNAFRYALRFAKQFGGELTLLHVLETGRRVGGMLELPRQNGGHDASLAPLRFPGMCRPVELRRRPGEVVVNETISIDIAAFGKKQQAYRNRR